MFGSVAHKVSFGKSLTLNISANTKNYNVKAAALAAGWNGITPLKVTVNVAPGVVVGSTSTGSFSLTSGSGFPLGSKLFLNVGAGAYIVGMGGNGGYGGASPSSGYAGGPALQTTIPTYITNNGTIGGGGGGGGAAAACGPGCFYGGGGGGAGDSVGGPGASGGGGGCNITCDPGTLTTGGQGYAGDGSYGRVATGWTGGTLGSAGTSGCSTGGGAAGACTSGNSNITWLAAGTRLGALN